MDSVVMLDQWVSPGRTGMGWTVWCCGTSGCRLDVRGWDGQCGDLEPVGVAGTYGGGMDSVVMWNQWVSPGRTGVGWTVW